MGHARALMGLSSAGTQIQIWKKTVKQGWSVRNVEKVVRDKLEGTGEVKNKEIPRKSSYLVEMEDELRSIFGTQVFVKPSSRGGKIEVSYYSDEDLGRIVELLYKIK